MRLFQCSLGRIDPLTDTRNRLGGLTRTLDSHRQILFAHQSGDPGGANGISHTLQQLGDTSIAVCGITTHNQLGRGKG